MRKTFAIMFSAAVLLAIVSGSAHAYKFDIAVDSSAKGITLTFTRGALLLNSQTINLTGAGDPPQTLWIMPGLYVMLSIKEINPDKPQLTLHYVVVGGAVLKKDQEGDILLPFEHFYITNRIFYATIDPSINYDLYGATNVGFRNTNYSLQFGLPELSNLWTAQVNPSNNEIHQTITRDNDLQFADINLKFQPRLLYTKVTFDVSMTPQSDTFPNPDEAKFAGTLPMPYGSYHFWFYRDSKN